MKNLILFFFFLSIALASTVQNQVASTPDFASVRAVPTDPHVYADTLVEKSVRKAVAKSKKTERIEARKQRRAKNSEAVGDPKSEKKKKVKKARKPKISPRDF